jgi:hypothetical protein
MKYDNLNELLRSSVVIDTRDILELKEEFISLDEYYYNEEVDKIDKLIDDISDHNSEVEYGVTLILDSYFEEYARGLIEGCYDLSDEIPDIMKNNINWKGIVNDLKVDYTYIEFEDLKFWCIVN